mmetsp:Transcript_25587/g.42873  ORF Transcript_25587/g.42873 Transcript_25587/m.42873 type:complete len:300 (-) Transcript_25587:365-1264(-)
MGLWRAALTVIGILIANGDRAEGPSEDEGTCAASSQACDIGEEEEAGQAPRNSLRRQFPLYHHGFREPVDLPCIHEELAEETFARLLKLREQWVTREAGSEDTIKSIPGYERILKSLGISYFTLGAIHNYMNDEECKEMVAKIDRVMWDHFGPVYKQVVQTLESQLGEPVRLYRGHHLAFRILSSEVLKSREAREIVNKFHSPPHFDGVIESMDWPEGTQTNHSISFTLPIKLPVNGHGLKIYHAYHDSFNNIWKDYELNDIEPISNAQAYELPSHIHKYVRSLCRDAFCFVLVASVVQ